MGSRSAVSYPYGERARIGMLLPSVNVAAEVQMQALLPAGVSLHTTRLKLNGGSDAALQAMTRDVEAATDLLSDIDPAVILFHCTAVSTWDRAMDATLCPRMAQASRCQTITTARALLEALAVFGTSRLQMVSPYIDAIHQREIDFFAAHGIETVATAAMGLASPQGMYAVTPAHWKKLVLSTRSADAQACLISCTAVRSMEVIDDLEQTLGIPVLTSNQAALWYALSAAGIADSVRGAGALLSERPELKLVTA